MTIELEDICKSYGSLTVLSHFSLAIDDGASLVITGPSGRGKTTLTRILLGLEKPDQGRVRLLGDYKYPYLNAGVVFQEDRLCDDFSAIVNVSMVNKHISSTFAREELENLLPPEALDKPVRELSGGMRRRVCIVRAAAVLEFCRQVRLSSFVNVVT